MSKIQRNGFDSHKHPQCTLDTVYFVLYIAAPYK